MNNTYNSPTKIKSSEKIYTLKIKTESKGLGLLKTFIVLGLIFLQLVVLVLSSLSSIQAYQWFFFLSMGLSLIASLHVLSSDYHGQAKATWILFLLVCYSFGYIIYFFSDKRILFAKSRKKYEKILKNTENLQQQIDLSDVNSDAKNKCHFLYNSGKFIAHKKSKTTYFPSGAGFYDDLLENLEKAEKFIFIEYYIIANGVLFDRFFDVLEKKANSGVDVRIIYDDMGSHGTLKRKNKRKLINAGIKIHAFNRLVPFFIISLNLRDHRKIVVIDGKVCYTGGTNLADEYINEKRVYGYWKDSGIKIEGQATDNLTIAFLTQWEFLTGEQIDYQKYLKLAPELDTNNEIVVPYVSGPNYKFSISQNMYMSEIASAKETLYIMTPYFIPDETLNNMLIEKAREGVDVRIILPDIADKKFVYVVSRNNAERLMEHGIKIYTMTHSFVHSKIVYTEKSAIVGSINVDLRSFFQQFESAVLTTEKQTLDCINQDFEKTFLYCKLITEQTKRRNKLHYRILAGIFKIVSPFM